MKKCFVVVMLIVLVFCSSSCFANNVNYDLMLYQAFDGMSRCQNIINYDYWDFGYSKGEYQKFFGKFFAKDCEQLVQEINTVIINNKIGDFTVFKGEYDPELFSNVITDEGMCFLIVNNDFSTVKCFISKRILICISTFVDIEGKDITRHDYKLIK